MLQRQNLALICVRSADSPLQLPPGNSSEGRPLTSWVELTLQSSLALGRQTGNKAHNERECGGESAPSRFSLSAPPVWLLFRSVTFLPPDSWLLPPSDNDQPGSEREPQPPPRPPAGLVDAEADPSEPHTKPTFTVSGACTAHAEVQNPDDYSPHLLSPKHTHFSPTPPPFKDPSQTTQNRVCSLAADYFRLCPNGAKNRRTLSSKRQLPVGFTEDPRNAVTAFSPLFHRFRRACRDHRAGRLCRPPRVQVRQLFRPSVQLLFGFKVVFPSLGCSLSGLHFLLLNGGVFFFLFTPLFALLNRGTASEFVYVEGVQNAWLRLTARAACFRHMVTRQSALGDRLQ